MVGLLAKVLGLPGGAPPETCFDLTPRHPGGSRQSSYPPYQVLPAAGQGRVRLTLGSPQGLPYEGFMIVARDVETGYNVGEFANLPDSARHVECTRDMKVFLLERWGEMIIWDFCYFFFSNGKILIRDNSRHLIYSVVGSFFFYFYRALSLCEEKCSSLHSENGRSSLDSDSIRNFVFSSVSSNLRQFYCMIRRSDKITVEFLEINITSFKASLVRFYDALQFAFDTLQ